MPLAGGIMSDVHSAQTPTQPSISAAQAPSRGTFIVIEGLDRSGKSTQVAALVTALRACGRTVEQLRFPDRTTPIGKMINDYLQSQTDLDDHVVHLLFSANRWELAKHIERTLGAGTDVVCDRYYYSGMIYSAAKQLPSLTLEWARQPDVGLPRPDLVVLLRLNAAAQARRAGFGDERYEKDDMQARVRELFADVLCEDGRRRRPRKCGERSYEECEDTVALEADTTQEQLGRAVLACALRVVSQVDEGKMGREVRRLQEWPSPETDGFADKSTACI